MGWASLYYWFLRTDVVLTRLVVLLRVRVPGLYRFNLWRVIVLFYVRKLCWDWLGKFCCSCGHEAVSVSCYWGRIWTNRGFRLHILCLNIFGWFYGVFVYGIW